MTEFSRYKSIPKGRKLLDMINPNNILTENKPMHNRELRRLKQNELSSIDNINDFIKPYSGAYQAIISLTSWRARINNVHITIENLILTCPGFKLVLVLSEEEFPNKESELPYNLIKLVNSNLIEILWVYKNYKAFKKVVFTMNKYRNVPIISADDDCIYFYNYAQEFYNIWEKNKDCFVSGWGREENGVWELGGFATLYPPYIFKNLGIDCITDELMNLTLQDDVYYQCLRKLMNLNKVIIKPLNERFEFHNEITPIKNEYKNMNYSEIHILRDKINDLITPIIKNSSIDKSYNENIIIGVLLEKEDPQRENKLLDSNNYKTIKTFIETASTFGYKIKILHNNLSDEFVKKYSNKKLEFIKVAPNKEYNVYINKFQLINEYLFKNPVNKVLISDLTDVVFLNSGLFDYFQDNILYSGSENNMLNNSWIEQNSTKIRNNDKFNKWWELNKNTLKLLNCGLIGGKYDFLKHELEEMVNILNLYAKNNNEISEMFTWNFVVYNSGKEILTGEPFHTEYKSYDLQNKISYLAHK